MRLKGKWEAVLGRVGSPVGLTIRAEELSIFETSRNDARERQMHCRSLSLFAGLAGPHLAQPPMLIFAGGSLAGKDSIDASSM